MRVWRSSLLLVAFVVCVTATLCGEEHSKDAPVIAAAKRHYDAGLQLAQTNHPQEAEREFNAALDIQPDFGDALFQMGLVELRAQRSQEALRSFIRLSELEPDRARGHFYLGLIFAGLGRVEGAELEFQLALGIDPKDADVRYNLALAEARQEKYEEAKATLAALLRDLPENPEAHRLMANVAAELKDAATAQREFERAAELLPNDPKSYLDLGNFYAAANDYEPARAAFEKAIQLSPANARAARMALARAAHALGRDQDAIQALGPVLDKQDDAEALILRGLSYEQLGEFVQAKKDYRRLIEIAPRDYRGYQLLGSRLLEENDLRAAISALENAVKLAPDFAGAHLALGKAYWRAQRADDAEKLAREAIRLAPENSSAHYLLAQALERRGDAAGAQAELEIVQKLNARARSGTGPP